MTFTAESVTGADDGRVSYRRVGAGPGVIVVHGGLQTWHSQRELAEALAPRFTVYLVDRRGRGASSPPPDDYGMATEVGDLHAVARQTGARFVFGVSAGAIIALHTSLQHRGLFTRVAVFEPPVVLPPRFGELAPRVDEAYARGDAAALFLTTMQATEMSPLFLRVLPGPVARRLVDWGMSRQDKSKAAGANDDEVDDGEQPPSLRKLAPTAKYDLQLVRSVHDEPVDRFAALSEHGTRVLLVSGSKTRPFLTQGCAALEAALPGLRHETLRGLDHLGSGNRDMGGRPEMVAEVLIDFFGEEESKVSGQTAATDATQTPQTQVQTQP
jgi:pimeloyl-ACP methyl ester carboxylesterase